MLKNYFKDVKASCNHNQMRVGMLRAHRHPELVRQFRFWGNRNCRAPWATRVPWNVTNFLKQPDPLPHEIRVLGCISSCFRIMRNCIWFQMNLEWCDLFRTVCRESHFPNVLEFKHQITQGLFLRLNKSFGCLEYHILKCL